MPLNRILFILAIAFLSCSSNNDPQPEENPPVQTVIYLIRHAEKADNSANPNLSEAGLQRAQAWAAMLQDVPFEAVYSTNFNRTMQTAEPIANAIGKSITIYNHAGFSLQSLVAKYPGKNIFVMGHNNTVPALVNAIVGSAVYPNMAENEFGNLYKVTVVDGVVWHEMTVHN